MVRYELALILRTVSSSKLKDAFTEAAKVVLEEGALLRQFQNHGERRLPYRIRAHEHWHDRGRYVVCDIEAGPTMSKTILEKIRNNQNTIRASLMKLQ